MIRKIIRYPNPSLRSACAPIDFAVARAWDKGEGLSAHIQDLKDTLAATPNGLALASNQIVPQGWRVFVAQPGLRVPRVATMASHDPDGMQSFPEVCINPKWEVYPPHEIDTIGPHDLADHVRFIEGCLSIPELSIPCTREHWIDLEYTDEDGARCIYVCRGIGARIVQHECDHLDGKLLIDHADKKTKIRVKQQAIRNRKAGR
jgi:peptide deformylase